MKYSKILLSFILGIMIIFSASLVFGGSFTTGTNDNNVTLSENVQPYGILMITFGTKMSENVIKFAANDAKLSEPEVKNNLSENEVNTEFSNVRNIPYNEKSMNCKNKSEQFAAYLKNNGATDIYIVTIQQDSNEYSHEFVEWNGKYYDACNNKQLSYLVSKQDYMNKLHKIGFNGVSVQYPY